MTARTIEPNDVLNLKVVSDPQVSPDGSRVLFTRKEVDKETGKAYSNLWIASRDGSIRSFTQGLHRDMLASWSPDGQWIAFLTTRKDVTKESGAAGGAQIALIPAQGGEARLLTNLKGAIAGFSWSPDSKSLVFPFRKSEELPKGETSPVTIRVTRLRYKFDGGGYLPPDRFHIHTLAIDDPESLKQLTDGDWDDTGATYSPDGEKIVFTTNRREDRETDDENRDVWVMNRDGSDARQLSQLRGVSYTPVFTPDGDRIVFMCTPGEKGNSFWGNAHIFAVDVEGDGGEWDLTPGLDRSVVNMTISELYGLEHLISAPNFDSDGTSVTFVVSDSGRSWVGRAPIVGREEKAGDVIRVYDGESVVTFQQAEPGGPAALLVTGSTYPCRILLSRSDFHYPEVLVDPNSDWMQDVTTFDVEPIQVSPEKGIDIHGWYMKPKGKGPFPLILYIHGGPHLAYGVPFSPEFQYLAGKGYAIVYGNPRGSHCYGLEHTSCVVSDWGDRPYADLMALVDEVAARPEIDSDRIGVAGGSYGGYMTLWILGHSERFKTGIAQRPVSELTSMLSCDFGGFMHVLFGMFPWEDPERFARLSPYTYVHDIKSPLLLILGLADQRTPSGQGEQVYVTLKKLGREVEMLLFPGADHHLTRTGRPSQKVAFLEAVGEWFERTL